MISFLSSIVSLVYLLFQEYFSMRAKAQEEQREFDLSQTELRALVDSAMEKWISRAAKRSAEAGNAWDVADNNKK